MENTKLVNAGALWKANSEMETKYEGMLAWNLKASLERAGEDYVLNGIVMRDKQEAHKFELCKIYSRESKKSGKKFLTGALNGSTSIMIFKNEHKKADNHPDFRIVLGEKQKKEESKENKPEGLEEW